MRNMTFADKTTRGGRSGGWEREIAEERLTVCELIRQVLRKVPDYNARPTEVFQGLAQPEDTEVTFLKLVPPVGG